MAIGTLEVHLHGGKDMRNVEFFGKNDPYALVSYKKQDQKSKTLEGGGADPVWDQSFFFEVDDDVADVIIKIFDEDKHSKDDAIGEAKISIARALEEFEMPAHSYDLVLSNGSRQGQVEVSLKFVPTVQESNPEPPPFHPGGPHHHHADHFGDPYHHDSHFDRPSHGGSSGPHGDPNHHASHFDRPSHGRSSGPYGDPNRHGSHSDRPSHGGSDGPYGDNNEGGWQ